MREISKEKLDEILGKHQSWLNNEDGGEFLRGQRDCQAGIPHKPGQSNDYNRGYSAQYTAEQIKSERN